MLVRRERVAGSPPVLHRVTGWADSRGAFDGRQGGGGGPLWGESACGPSEAVVRHFSGENCTA